MVLNRLQRDALYQFVLADLVGIGDVAIVLQKGEVAEAQRLRGHGEEDFRLLDLLGWRAAEARDRYELARSGETLRVFGRLHAAATGAIARTVAEFASDELEEAISVAETCALMLRGSQSGSVDVQG
jgi:hypothetical protein